MELKNIIAKKIKNKEDEKIIYNLNHFSYYFNGMLFESIATEALFNLINGNSYDEELNKKAISFLPRMIFYLKKDEDKIDESKDYHGYNELDCAFILKEKDKVVLEKDKITCFKSFDSKKESDFYNFHNIEDNITLKKDDIVILEIKSSWRNLKGEEENYEDNNNEIENNLLKKFIIKAKRFIEHYEELNLIKKDQNKILIYLYNYSMCYNIEEQNDKIRKAFEMIENDDKIQLYIAYFQPYLKVMGSYERVTTISTLKKKVKEQEAKVKEQEEKAREFDENFKKLKDEKEQEQKTSKKLEEEVKKLKNVNDELDKKLQEQQNNLEMQKKLFEDKFKQLQDDNKKLLEMIENLKHEQKMNSKKNYDKEKNDSADDIEEKCEQNDKIADGNKKGNKEKNKKDSLTSIDGTKANTIDSVNKD